MNLVLRDFRIFIDAATLKQGLLSSRGKNRRNFRIFIDAATLKQDAGTWMCGHGKEFPHLYRCGHIEATVYGWGEGKECWISASL